MTDYKRHESFLTPALVLKAMIYTNVIMFGISLIFSGKNITLTLNPFYALTPSMDVLKFLGASGRFPIVKFEAWWSLITANWLHGGLLHILFNMMALRTVAPLVMQEFGLSRMFSIYTLAGISGFLLSYAGNVYLTIGASSGLCGLIGAALYFGKSRGGQWGQLVYKQTSGWVVSLVLIGFLMPHINNWGHAGGLFGGIFFGWILGYNEKRKENLFDISVAVFFVAITVWLLANAVIQGFFLIYT
ncbi:MAG: rhomboid family intramembrane serine protease [Proteobacteria bacterium]|nr:rhomboid family intramembrane serine protease [Pseudomonadota bacterium]MBU1585572.1 rhomboid family intramembrane serine protease [Pseudomonadota bacterium]